MNCPPDNRLLNDYLDGRLRPEEQDAVDEHIAHCSRCWLALRQERQLRAALRSAPVEPASPGFAARALRNASHRERQWPGFAAGFSIAAVLMLVMWITLITIRPAAAPEVTLALYTPQDVRLVFSSEQEIGGATLVLVLPRNVELAGHPDTRELQWQTSLAQGRNLMVLPLIARGAGQGEVIARLTHGS